MKSQEFSDDEKRIISRTLFRKSGKSEQLFSYVVYLLPTFLFAIYGFWTRDFLAEFIAFLALFIIVILYITYVWRDWSVFHSAIKKYEEQVGALKSREENKI